MNTESIARTQFPAGLRRWLYTGLLVLLALTLSPAAPATLHNGQGGRLSPALVSNGGGGGCG